MSLTSLIFASFLAASSPNKSLVVKTNEIVNSPKESAHLQVATTTQESFYSSEKSSELATELESNPSHEEDQIIITIPKPKTTNPHNSKVDPIMPLELLIVSQTEGEDFADDRPEFAKEGEKVILYAVVKAKDKDGKTVFYTEAPKLKINNKKISPAQIISPKDIGRSLEWFKLEPAGENYNNKRNDKFKLEKIDYAQTLFTEGWSAQANSHPTILYDAFKHLKTGLGVMRYQLTFTDSQGKEFSTPGIECRSKGGLCDKVHKVAFREDNGNWTDYAFELFNSPYIWGSIGKQVDRQIGVDCADLVVYAKRRHQEETSGKKRQPYTWSYGLEKYTNTIVEFDGADIWGNPLADGKLVKFNETVQEGDILLFPRHAAILYKDSSIKGVEGTLDAYDLAIHTLFNEPEIISIGDISSQVGPPLKILRWKK
ncbi:hypothetical protein HOC13_00365 [Candidatus Woesearchaeota archaeon]|jgi:hypothetical protein|nr:hypothetical protein [Candidatus Woesearchaeota archaeon]